MSAPRFARGSKSRIFLYVGTVFAFGVAVCIIHETQVQLNESRKTAEKCQQQQESLSAQLQVIYEYKLRLEKSLQEEKALHRKTRQEFESQIDTEKQVREKDGIESVNKYNSLQQQYKILQGQHEDLTEECSKIRQSQVVAAGERSRLESEVAAARQELEQVQAVRDKEVEALKTQYLEVVTENERLRKKYSDLEVKAQHSAADLNYLSKQNIQLERELGDNQKDLASCLRKAGDIATGIVNKRNVEVILPVQPPSVSKKVSSSSPSVPAAVPKAEEDSGKNVLPQPVGIAHKVSSSTSHGSLVSNAATPKGKLAADRPQSNNVIPVPPPQGAQLGGAAEAPSEGSERDNVQQAAAQSPADGVGARPPDSPNRENHNKETEHEDELKAKEADHPMEVGDGVGAAPDLMKHSEDHHNDNKEHAYRAQGAGMQWGLAPPAPYEAHQQGLVPIPYQYANHQHQALQKPYNSDILQNSIHRDDGHPRIYHQDLPRLQPPIPLPRSQHDANSVLQHPLPLPNRKPIGGFGMKEVEPHMQGDERGEEEVVPAARRWPIREQQRPLAGLFPYHGAAGGGDYGREDEGEEGEDREVGKAVGRGARAQWGAEHKDAPENAQEDLQLEEGDEDDEDVDQIDYGANEAAGANVADKEAKHQVLEKVEKKRDSVMVNPK